MAEFFSVFANFMAVILIIGCWVRSSKDSFAIINLWIPPSLPSVLYHFLVLVLYLVCRGSVVRKMCIQGFTLHGEFSLSLLCKVHLFF